MKKINVMWAAIALMMVTTWSACSKSEDDATPDNKNNELRKILMSNSPKAL